MLTLVTMKRIAIVLLPAAILAHGAAQADEPSGYPTAVGRANLLGVVQRVDGAGVPDVDVLLLHQEHHAEIARVTTAADGTYEFGCVDEGTYQLRLDPKASGLGGRTVVAPVGPRGLTVAWTAAGDEPALALGSSQGGACATDDVVVPPPLPAAEGATVSSSNLATIGTVSGVIAVGGTLGGLAASGAFDGSGSSGDGGGSPASPIQ